MDRPPDKPLSPDTFARARTGLGISRGEQASKMSAQGVANKVGHDQIRSPPKMNSPQAQSGAQTAHSTRSVSGRALFGRSYRLGGNLDTALQDRSLQSLATEDRQRRASLDPATVSSSVRNRSAELGAAAMEYHGSQKREPSTRIDRSIRMDNRHLASSPQSGSSAPPKVVTEVHEDDLRKTSAANSEGSMQAGPSIVKDFELPTSPPSAGSSVKHSTVPKASPSIPTTPLTPTFSERDIPSALSVMIQRHTPNGSRASSRSNSLSRQPVEGIQNGQATLPGKKDFQDLWTQQPRNPLFPRTRSRESIHLRGDQYSTDSADRPLLATFEDETTAMKELRRRDKARYGDHARYGDRRSDGIASIDPQASSNSTQTVTRSGGDLERSDHNIRTGTSSGLEGIPEERVAQNESVPVFDQIFNYASRLRWSPTKPPTAGRSNQRTDKSYNTFRDPSIGASDYPYKSRESGSIVQRSISRLIDRLLKLTASRTSLHSISDLMKAPIKCMPAVVLGTLLNILDGVSYGMITFPTNLAVFASFGGDGVSMYFVSCIVSQLVYSWGGSAFGGGNGTMMIEIVPFLHIIAQIIIDTIGDSQLNAQAIRATTMVAFALSSVLTGFTFMLLGALRLGALIGFFPRHILVGCIGGVGVFLFVTGIEVAARLEDNLVLSLEHARHLFLDTHILALWTIPLGLAILLRLITRKFDHPLLTPAYFISVPLIFYLIKAIGGWDLDTLRKSGWLFDVQGDGTPWYNFYTYFDFSATNWGAIMATIPSQLALVFFGILHVPINVPALGVSLQKDDINTDRELIAHGASNLLSGAVGSVPNYLCYVNSVLFYRVGGDSRLAGTMLALSTFIIMLLGPGVIGFIPVCVVGALIFLLGMDLIKEAVWDTWGKTDRMETLTIWAIMISMTYWDFVIGIGVGIVLACFFFVVMTSRRQAIRVTYTGETAKSTVRRHVTQRSFLRAVGKQILVFKLQGFLFFGTISAVEDRISQILDLASWQHHPIRFLILDMSLVSGVDFSAAEAFLRIKRLLRTREVIFILTGSSSTSPGGMALRTAGIWEDSVNEESPLQAFDDMNEALEWCENALLKQLYAVKAQTDSDFHIGSTLPVSLGGMHDERSEHEGTQKQPLLPEEISPSEFSPRRTHLREAARQTFKHHDAHIRRRQLETSEQPVPLLMQVFSAYQSDDQSFFESIAPFFKRIVLEPGAILFKEGEDPNAMYLIESGVLRATYSFAERVVVEAMLPGCIAGDMSFISGVQRNAAVQAERQSVLWMLDEEGKMKISEQGSSTYNMFIGMILRCSADEQDVLLHYLVTALS